MKKIAFAAALTTLVTACGGGGGEAEDLTSTPSGTETNSVTLSDMTGVWNATRETVSGRDIVYMAIDTSGLVRDYDYMGDSYDGGDACYWLSGDTINDQVQFTDNGNGQFTITSNNFGTVVSTPMTASLIGNTITLTWVDAFDDDEDGDTTESQSLTMTRRPDIKESDFVPLCDDEGNLSDGTVEDPEVPTGIEPEEDLLAQSDATLKSIQGLWQTFDFSFRTFGDWYTNIDASGSVTTFYPRKVIRSGKPVSCYGDIWSERGLELVLTTAQTGHLTGTFSGNDTSSSTEFSVNKDGIFYEYNLIFKDIVDYDNDGNYEDLVNIELGKPAEKALADVAPLCSSLGPDQGGSNDASADPYSCEDLISSAIGTYGEPEDSSHYSNDGYRSQSLWWYSKGINLSYTYDSYSDDTCSIRTYTFTPH